ncbi:MAG TPA: aspartate carbamoyltransferase [Thermomicrobiales bacterium]|nr:aspartate carbamoyltransferase [Thermomicrobiales bacterium]
MPRHIVEVSQFSRGDLEFVFDRADEMRLLPKPDHRLDGLVLATLFYEPSTRTRLSFESSMLRLSGSVISTENAREFSSAIKGESVEDTIRIVEGYADAIVIRHYEQGAAARAAAVASVPIINGGDGPGEHPTQALLDLYTIRHALGRVDDLRIALVGDLRYGRAVRSLAMLLTRSTGIELVFVAPPEVTMGDDVRQALASAGIPIRDESDLSKAVRDVDVVYQTRIQKERFASEADYARNKGIYIVNDETMADLPDSAIVMHPLPRVDEISPAFDHDPRAKYFDEARNGVYVRMALLDALLAGPWRA